jgi:hypothetical protein
VKLSVLQESVSKLHAKEIKNFSLFEDTGCQFKAINPKLYLGEEYNAWALVNEKNELLIGCNMLINDNTKNIFENLCFSLKNNLTTCFRKDSFTKKSFFHRI